MQHTIKLSLLAALAAGMVIAACGDDETTPAPTTATTTTTSTSASGGTGGSGATGGGLPSAPTLGSQVDRKGRPAINTALNQAFILENGMASTDAARGMAEDDYNADGAAASWAGDYAEVFRSNIAIVDSVDGICGNNVAFDALSLPNYTALATVLANDWLVVKGDAVQCDNYLGVETTTLGLTTSDDCGGRRPADDVVDASYGALSGASGFGDNIGPTAAAQVTAFPYLASPN
jgi:hypothetical protein